ncbi:ferredoxin [Kineococcus sp. SYSU DK018]|uniref:ferredoxin n=1 Tax=Kineococcus sp. SYSU DK018 TaxID=3383139 RepID=UPI003D7EF229
MVVDLARCEGHGLCVFAAPEVFDLNDDGRLLYDPHPPETLRGAVEDAVRSCPAGAIRLMSEPSAGTDRSLAVARPGQIASSASSPEPASAASVAPSTLPRQGEPVSELVGELVGEPRSRSLR